jgi:hypothetical protein
MSLMMKIFMFCLQFFSAGPEKSSTENKDGKTSTVTAEGEKEEKKKEKKKKDREKLIEDELKDLVKNVGTKKRHFRSDGKLQLTQRSDNSHLIHIYSETSLYRLVLGQKKYGQFRGWDGRFCETSFAKNCLTRTLKNWPIFREGRFF